MPRHTPHLAALAALAMSLGACTGTEVGNPGNASVRVQFTVVQPASGALTLAGAEVTEVWIVLGEVELRDTMFCDDEEPDDESIISEYEVPGPFAVELISGRELPAVPTLMPPGGAFCRVELELEAVELAEDLPAGAPVELAERSVWIRGTRADGRAFEIVLERDPTIDLRAAAADGFVLDSDQALVVGFDVGGWLLAVGLDDLEPDADGVVRIDSESNADLRDAIIERLEDGADLRRDLDEDGEIDEDDDDLD